MLILVDGVEDWVPLPNLPGWTNSWRDGFQNARASIVGGKLILTGGKTDPIKYRSEVND